jgi:Putative Ig domain
MPSLANLVKLTLIFGGLLLITGCGGGGGATSSPSSSALVQGSTSNSSSGSGGVTGGSTTGNGVGVSDDTPTITGEPDPAVTAGDSYEFQPVASDPQGERLTFSVVNLPSWAQFDTSTGRLSGIPGAADIGTYQDILIRVSDSRATGSLPPFVIEVTQIGVGFAVVAWSPPEFNTDGSALTDLAGYRIHFGRSTRSMSKVVSVSGAGVLRTVIDNLSKGPWYFAVSAVNSHGVQSNLSGIGFKRVK